MQQRTYLAIFSQYLYIHFKIKTECQTRSNIFDDFFLNFEYFFANIQGYLILPHSLCYWWSSYALFATSFLRRFGNGTRRTVRAEESRNMWLRSWCAMFRFEKFNNISFGNWIIRRITKTLCNNGIGILYFDHRNNKNWT